MITIYKIMCFLVLGGISIYDFVATFQVKDYYNTTLCGVLLLVLGILAVLSFRS